MATKRAIIYSRVSTDDQRSNFSIPTQISECVKYCQNNGYTLGGNAFVDKQSGLDVEKNPNSIPAYVDDYSSREMNRPSLDAALTYLEDYGFDVVVVHSIDRLARDPYIRQTLEKEFFRRGAKVEFARCAKIWTPRLTSGRTQNGLSAVIVGNVVKPKRVCMLVDGPRMVTFWMQKGWVGFLSIPSKPRSFD